MIQFSPVFINMIYGFLAYIDSVLIALAAIIAVFLTDWLNRRRGEKTKEASIRSTRTLIRLEIDQNLSLLKTYLEKVNQIQKNDLKAEEDENILLARNLISVPIPSWKQIMWFKLASMLAEALNESEIKEIQIFFDNLDVLKTIHLQLVELSNRDAEDLKLMPIDETRGVHTTPVTYDEFHNQFESGSPELYVEFDKTAKDIFANGNALEKDENKL